MFIKKCAEDIEDKDMEIKKCVVCGSKSIVSAGGDVYECLDCSHKYVNYTGDGLNYHKNEYRNNNHGTRTTDEIDNGEFTQKFHDFRDEICKKRINLIKDFIDECDSLLDIGAGGGTFVNMIKDNFTTVECQEISDICVNNLNRYGYHTYHGDFNDLNFNRTYDLVTCWQVLEHIKDLHSFVENASKITDKYLVLEVPLLHSKGTRTRGIPPVDRWDGHYHFFSQRSMTKLFEQHFEILDLQEPGIQIPSLSVLLKKK